MAYLRQYNVWRWVLGGLACYGVLLGLAAWRLPVAIGVIAGAIGASSLYWAKVGPVGGYGKSPSRRGKHHLALVALVVLPVGVNILLLPLGAAAGSPLDEPYLGLGATAVTAVGSGLIAAQRGAPASSHGWWALAGAGSAMLVFGALSVVAGS